MLNAVSMVSMVSIVSIKKTASLFFGGWPFLIGGAGEDLSDLSDLSGFLIDGGF